MSRKDEIAELLKKARKLEAEDKVEDAIAAINAAVDVLNETVVALKNGLELSSQRTRVKDTLIRLHSSLDLY